ncbi:protein DOG1-like 4 [Ziziphus jujuba]|uniref:Protein DOG1-like 4 n=2 Tax=Ziziphus jujuba TaxID=326968 RepID=A0A6P3Z9A9_ZIZJJ|nr:protein DOG1-like 4 [Ziziphus jujuba]KAH7544984.1 hypothetical protein FEM48_Zijuj01G0044000 [Ziziphus jujuba var. spinosa]
MKTKVEQSFSDFYEEWMDQLEQHLQNLQKVVSKLDAQDHDHDQDETDQDPLQALVSTVTAHYKNYYTVKWAAAHEDVLAFYCPVWLSPLENACSWITDWKPSMVFRLIESLSKARLQGSNLADLTDEQVKKIEELRVKIRMEEEKVESEMERQQMAIADRKMVELSRLATKIRNGETTYQIEGLVEVAIKGLLSGLERVMKAGDCVRLKTLKVVLEILGPLQCVRFLAAMSMLQIQIRKCGKKRAAATTTTTGE